MDKNETEQDIRKAGMFPICLDESTYATSADHIAVIARFPSADIIKYELMKLMTLSEKTRGKDITNKLKK